MNAKRYFRSFMDLSTGGIYAFENPRHKAVYISHSNDILKSLAVNINQIRTGVHPCPKLNSQHEHFRLVILETVDDLQQRYLRFEHYVSEYKKQGYRLYQYKKTLEYQVKLAIEKDFNPEHTNLLAYVTLVSKRGKKVVVGVFDDADEAKAWVEQIYRPLEQIIPIYATNQLTKEYLDYEKSKTQESNSNKPSL